MSITRADKFAESLYLYSKKFARKNTKKIKNQRCCPRIARIARIFVFSVFFHSVRNKLLGRNDKHTCNTTYSGRNAPNYAEVAFRQNAGFRTGAIFSTGRYIPTGCKTRYTCKS
jgi:hypothetical protein